MRDSTGYIRSMGITGTALTGRPCHVKQMDIHGQVAYHMRKGREDIVAIDFQQDFSCGEDEAATILYGLFTHEIMHAIRTDSSYKDQRLKEFPPEEQYSRKDIWNIVEDPAIEYFARWEVSDTLFQCLQKSIRYFYEESPEIQDCGDDAWLQFIASLVMFGDVGALKGKFTFPEALDCFKKCAPIMLGAIVEPDARKRFEMSQEIFDIARPLWEDHYENDINACNNEQEVLSGLGVTESNGTGDPVSNDSYGDEAEADDAMQRRKQIIQVLEDSDSKDSASGSGADGTQDTETGNSGQPSGSEQGDDTSSGNGQGTDSSGQPSGNESGTDSSGQASGNGQGTDSSGQPSGNKSGTGVQDMLDSVNEKLGKLLEQVSKDCKADPEAEAALRAAIKQLLAATLQKKDENQKAMRRDLDIDDLHLEVRSPYYKNSTMETFQITDTYEIGYDALCQKRHSEIVNFRAQLKKVLMDKYSKKEYSTKGKLSVDRMCGRKLTARVFERRKAPEDKSELAIVLMVDQSGSMMRSMGAVQEVCTILMEAFDEFDVPIKLVGFASAGDADADYYHYGKWSNDRRTRMMIPGMRSNGSTFLGHAIRYGGELLKKRPEKHKLFIMITDAEPCYGKYKSNDDAYSDCRYGVQDISKYADVLGLGIYDAADANSNKAFRFIFGKDCIAVNEPSAIVKDLPKMIGKFLKS